MLLVKVLRKDVSLQPPGDVKKTRLLVSHLKMLSLNNIPEQSLFWWDKVGTRAGKRFRHCVVSRQFKEKLTNFRWFEKLVKFYFKKISI